MPSGKKHPKDATKDKDKDNTYEKLSCNRIPKHSACDGKWFRFPKRSPEGDVEWVVEWAACREDDAVRCMKEKHGYIFNPKPRNEDDTKTEMRYSKKKHPNLHGFFFSAPRPSRKHNPAKVASEKHNTREQAAGRPRNEHRQRPPPTSAETPAERDAHRSRILASFQAESAAQEAAKQQNDPRVDAWMAEHEGPATAMPSDQSPVPPPGMALNPGMVPSQRTYTAGTGNMAPAPVMPPPQDARPHENNQRRRHQKSSSKYRPEQEPQPSTTVPPPGTPHGGQHRDHQSRHRRTNPKQEQQPSTAIQPPRAMPAGMVSPVGMNMLPRIPSTQGPMGGQQQRHQPVPNSHSSHGPGPQTSAITPQPPEVPAPAPAVGPAPVAYPPQAPPDGQQPNRRHQKSSRNPEAELKGAPQLTGAMIPPHGSMSESMSVMGEGTMAVTRTGGPQVYGGDVHTAGPSNMPPPMNTTMHARPAAEEISLLPAAQRGPGMPQFPRTHLFPTAPPQAGVIVVTADGAPGPQAVRARSSRRAAPKADMAMQPRPRMEPTPMSMPRFPGAGPGTPVPFDPSVSPPPLAPTPPVPDGALD